MKTKLFFTCMLFGVLLPFTFQAQSNSPCVDPNPVISGRDSICPGYTDSLFVTGGTTYWWSTGATTTGISVTPTITTTYTVEAFNGTCEHDTTFTIQIFPAPIPAIAASKDSVCSGDTLTLEASGGAVYIWSPGGSTSKTIHITLTTPTTYTLFAYGGKCMDSTTINIGVIRPVTGSISASPDTVCPLANVTLAATLNGGQAISYKWSNGATTSSINVTPTITTTYTATVYGKCDNLVLTARIVVIPLPTPVIKGTSPVCIGITDTLFISGGTYYVWSNGSTKSSYFTGPINADSTIYAVTYNSLGCSVKDSFTIVRTICEGIDELQNANQFNVFPDPNTGVFTLQLGLSGKEYGVSKMQVEVYNVMGERVNSEELRAKSEEIDMRNQPNGIYFYRVLDASGALVGEGKFVVEK